MALVRAEILTPWEDVANETGGVQRWPLVSSVFRLACWQDITGQPSANLLPNPNLFSILAVADETEIAAIKLDNRFFVVWEEYA